MSFESIATPEGFIGAAIGDSAQWRPAPSIKLEIRDGQAFLLWNWSIATQGEVASETTISQEFFTLPKPATHRSVIERAQRRIRETRDTTGIDSLIVLAKAVGARVQTLSRRTKGGKGLLDDFIRLASASDQKILAFARRWGPLYLCRHAMPFQHNAPGRAGYDPKDPCMPTSFSGAGSWAYERVADWRRYSSDAQKILKLVQIAWKMSQRERFKSVAFRKAMFAVNEWLSNAGAVISLGLDPAADGEIAIGVSESAGVFGLLGLQLMTTLTRSTSPLSCSSCGAGFIPVRLAPSGVRRYCARCRGAGAPVRDAARDHYARQRKTIT
ncbi:MAG: hypothetical protein C5B58_05235 [Acidobacteria bacterium]|nr:MAG: hypothetical protein C5B58_05235 [Acidobacteriota bacterium]